MIYLRILSEDIFVIEGKSLILNGYFHKLRPNFHKFLLSRPTKVLIVIRNMTF